MKDIVIAINNLCTGTEAKILLSLLLCEPEETSMKSMLMMTGITKPNNYFRTHKHLLDIGYLTIDESGMHVNTDKILADHPLDK